MANVRMAGVTKFFSMDKGYGFVQPDGGGADIFVHIKDLRRAGLQSISEGQKVEFDTEPGKDGKGPKAVNVALVR